MIAFLIFSVVLIIIASIIVAKKEFLSPRAKVLFAVVVVMMIVLAWMYENSVEKETHAHRSVVNAFKQGKSIFCDDVEITSKTFVYVSGTQSFIARDKNIEQQGLVIDVATCKTER